MYRQLSLDYFDLVLELKIRLFYMVSKQIYGRLFHRDILGKPELKNMTKKECDF